MISDAQQAANQANAQHSTGPKTAEGKARSSQNRLTHGLYSNQVILPSEDPAEFARLAACIVECFEAQSGYANVLALELATNTWKMNRYTAAETLFNTLRVDTYARWTEDKTLLNDPKERNRLFDNSGAYTDRVETAHKLIRSCQRRINELQKSLREIQLFERKSAKDRLPAFPTPEPAKSVIQTQPEPPSRDLSYTELVHHYQNKLMETHRAEAARMDSEREAKLEVQSQSTLEVAPEAEPEGFDNNPTIGMSPAEARIFYQNVLMEIQREYIAEATAVAQAKTGESKPNFRLVQG